MDSKMPSDTATNKYLEKLLDRGGQKQTVSDILKNAQQHVESKLKEGQINIPLPQDKNGEFSINLLKKKEINPFQSNYKGFFLNSDREKSHQRYEIFKKIKQEYSKQKTAVVVKQVQKKIKQWTAKKLELQRKKQRSLSRQNKMQLEMIQHLKRKQAQKMQAQKEMKRQELKNRIRLMQQKRQQRQQFIKQSSMRSLDIKSPKYKEMQHKFQEIQQKLKQERMKLLEAKRQSMSVNPKSIQQHAKKYEQIVKQREQQRANKLKLKLVDHNLQDRESFNAFNNELRIKKKQQAQKRKRMKDFQEKVKSSIIIRKKSQGNDNQQQAQTQIIRSKSKLQKSDIDKQMLNVQGKRVRKKKRKVNDEVDGRKLGNGYLNSLKEQGLNKTQKRSKIISSASLPSIKPQYKNYLTEIKVKRRPVGDEISELKRSCKNSNEVYQMLNKKSQVYQESMMKKINELKKINKYDESVVRQSQIDQLYARCVKIRLACIES